MHFRYPICALLLDLFHASTSASALPTTQCRLRSLLSCTFTSCSESSPNPIATQYPNAITGTINGTVAVVPIPYELARSIVPAQYGILTDAYRELLPGFPEGMYPLIIRSIIDHDIREYNINLVPDFQSIHIFYPFIDLLSDGYSSFAYEKYILVSGTNLVAQAGAAMYGETPVPSTFQPPGNAYAFAGDSGEISLNATAWSTSSLLGSMSKPTVTTRFTALSMVSWGLNFYVNITNQPIFSNGAKCDQQVTLFNTSISTGVNSPVGLKGEITVAAPYLPTDSSFKDVYGVKVDVAFIENNMLDCSTLKGQ